MSDKPNTPNGVMDAFSNPLARLGYDTPNLMEATEYPMTRLTRNFQLMNSLYRGSWIIRRVVDTIPEDMTKNWFKITSQLQPDQIDKFEKAQRQVKLKSKILEGLKWGKLYGGAIGIILIAGHEKILDKPLELDTVMPGSFKGLLVVDRWLGVYPDIQLIRDINNPDFGLPMYYNITVDPMGGEILRVHHSRVIRFIGNSLPRLEQISEMYWGASVVETVFDELKKRDNTSWNIAQMVFLADLRVYKTGDLEQLMSLGGGKIAEDFYNTLQAQNIMLSNMGMQVIGKDDDYIRQQFSFAGLGEVYDRFMMDVSGSARMPVTKLFGRSPAGMNSTGESDMQNYYGAVQQDQESILGPIIEKILPIMAMSELGGVPDDLDYAFEPIYSPKDDEKAELGSKQTASIVDTFNAGLVSERVALKELRQLKDITGMWSNITDGDIEKAADKPSQAAETAGLGGLSGLQPQSSISGAMDADWEEEKHPRGDDGKFGAGGASTTSSPSSGIEANKFSRGFSDSNLNVHWYTHKEEYPEYTKEQYAARALELIQMPVGGDILGYKNKDGQIVRYDTKTKDFVKGHQGIGIALMMRPTGGIKYFESCKKKEAVK